MERRTPKMNKSVYILLSRTGTLFSRAIRLATGNEFTHISFSFDNSLSQMYSFARRNPYLPFIAGFVHEDIRSGIFGKYPDAPCALYRLEVSEESFAVMRGMIDTFEQDYDKYRYSLLGPLLIEMDLPLHREYPFVCSQFVAHLLEKSGALAFPKDSALMTPMDFSYLPELEPLYFGTLEHYPFYRSQRVCY